MFCSFYLSFFFKLKTFNLALHPPFFFFRLKTFTIKGSNKFSSSNKFTVKGSNVQTSKLPNFENKEKENKKHPYILVRSRLLFFYLFIYEQLLSGLLFFCLTLSFLFYVSQISIPSSYFFFLFKNFFFTIIVYVFGIKFFYLGM